MKVDVEKCRGCGFCVEVCPLEVVSLRDKLAEIASGCVACQACVKVCPAGAITQDDQETTGAITCDACPVGCLIPQGKMGACKRFLNRNGEKVRTVALHTYEDIASFVIPQWAEPIQHPLITGIGAGTTYPDYRPAPFIVRGEVDGVDVVTAVTEAPLSYSGVKVKIDTDEVIGEEGADVVYGRHKIGHVTTEEYGSKILSIGGANLLTGKDGFVVARVVADIANRKEVLLKVREGVDLKLRVGYPPEIDGKAVRKMRVGCGSASMGLFAPHFRDAADEIVVIDSHVTGVFTEHTAGQYLGIPFSGVHLKFKKSTPGRYFGDHGRGWGGTTIEDPVSLIKAVDPEHGRKGMTILFTETTGQKAKLVRWKGEQTFEEIPLTEKAEKAVGQIRETSQSSRVSAVYVGGCGGSARVSITLFPVRLTEAIHRKEAKLTIGGAPTFIFPGGGITFMADVEEVKAGAFTWVPTPATVAPLEFTMTLETYLKIGGYVEAIIDKEALEVLLRRRGDRDEV